jgi:hypothetical protein
MAKAKSGGRASSPTKRLATPDAEPQLITSLAFGEPPKKPLMTERERRKRLSKVRRAASVGLGELPLRSPLPQPPATRGIAGRLRKPPRRAFNRPFSG